MPQPSVHLRRPRVRTQAFQSPSARRGLHRGGRYIPGQVLNVRAFAPVDIARVRMSEHRWLMVLEYEPIIDAEMVLSDGRTLAYAVWGDPDGETVFLFHGAPGSRLFVPDPSTTAQVGVRLVTVDRPGYGGSDPDAARQIVDWPSDVLQLAVVLQAGEFAVVAHSSGGPYALACALRMPERVSGVVLASCVAPCEVDPSGKDDEDQALTRRCQQDPDGAAVEIAGNAAWLVADPEHFLDLPRPDPDTQLLADTAIRSMFGRAVRESVKQGIGAYTRDCVLERRPWGFTLGDVNADVSIWHGGCDQSVAPGQAVTLNRGLPHSGLRMVPDAGHGLILGRWADILSDITGGDEVDAGTHPKFLLP
jgi:pimeloyl-ACP methyl ester carboxylesterase